MQTKFSIIIPTYNRDYILWKTIQSVQKQIHPFWEAIVIDDGSTDHTKQLVAEFQKDSRIKYVTTENQGASHARNLGMQHATGDIITYLDSDDILYENFLSTATEVFTKYPEKIFAIPNYNFRVELYDNNYHMIDFTEMGQRQGNVVTLQDVYHWKVKCAYGTGLLHRRKVIDDCVQWNEHLKVFDDWDFFMKLGTKYPKGFIHIPYVLYEYIQRYGNDGICSNTTYDDFAKAFQTMYDLHKDDIPMQGQMWYPKQVEKYKEKAKLYKEGKIESPVYKYFPTYFRH